MKSFQLSLLIAVVFVAGAASAGDYIIVGWNDLGMHCSNKDFSTMVVLPPYNVIYSQVIKVGDVDRMPELATTGLRITYSIPGNTYSVGKTNFWDYEDKLFGVELEPNIGLTMAGLSGELLAEEDHFHMDGIPITPYTDADLENEDPFQLILLSLYNEAGDVLATTEAVIPVSNEINCVSTECHASQESILVDHSERAGLDPADKPFLCASCHSSNALGTKGKEGVRSLSEAVHSGHGELTDDCFQCHPGPKTQCFRGVMKDKHDLVCQDCHGSVTEVGASIAGGRNPWLQEPRCGNDDCHGSDYAEEPGKLFRMSRGHGGLFCEACHGEPHAIVPSGEPRDNVQNIAIQGYAGILDKCEVCHGVMPDGPGPHGMVVSIEVPEVEDVGRD